MFMAMYMFHIAFALGLIALIMGLAMCKCCCKAVCDTRTAYDANAKPGYDANTMKCGSCKCNKICGIIISILALISLACTMNTGYKQMQAGMMDMGHMDMHRAKADMRHDNMRNDNVRNDNMRNDNTKVTE